MLNSTAKPWTPPPPATSDTKASNPPPLTTESSEPKEVPQPPKPSATPAQSANTENSSDESKTIPTPTTVPAPAPPKPSVWGKKPSNAILTAPVPEQIAVPQPRRSTSNNNNNNKGGNWRNNNQRRNNDRDNNNNTGGRHFSGGRGHGGRGRGHNNNYQRKNDDNGANNDSNNEGWTRGKSLPLDLLKPKEGKTEEEKAVGRIKAEELLSLRLSFVAPPLSWEQNVQTEDEDADEAVVVTVIGPPDECRWISDTRVQQIDAMSNAKRKGGDVSSNKKKKQENETAPPLEDCKPLEVNEETRWKAGVFRKDGKTGDATEESNDAILKKSLLMTSGHETVMERGGMDDLYMPPENDEESERSSSGSYSCLQGVFRVCFGN